MATPPEVPTWFTTTVRPNNQDKTLFQKMKNKVHESRRDVESVLPSFVRKYVNVSKWTEPTFLSYEDCKKPNNKGSYCKSENGKIIQADDQMVNFKRLSKRNNNDKLNYESRKKRYHRSKNYNEKSKTITYTRKNGSVEKIPVDFTSLHFYTAKAPRFKARHSAYKLNTSRLNLAKKKIIAGNFDFSLYQERLQSKDASIREQAIDELRLLQQILADARKMRRETLESRYETLGNVKKAASILGMGLGMGIGASSDVAFALGKVATGVGFGSMLKHEKLRHAAEISAPAIDLIKKVTLASVIGLAVHLSNPGVTVAISAVVASTIGLGATIARKHIEFQKITTEMDGDTVSETINKLIQKNGVLTMEDNPMFAHALQLKQTLEQAMAQGKNINSFINQEVPEKNRKNARNMIEDIQWAEGMKQALRNAQAQGKNMTSYINTEIPEADRNYVRTIYANMKQRST
jgi:hypothetical protein